MSSNQPSGPKRLTVFGATGLTGRKIVELALARANRVTTFTRQAASLKDLAGRVDVVEGDATDPAVVDKAVLGSYAVLSALGHGKGSPGNLETVALGNIVAAMSKNGVRRLVVLSGAALRDPADKPTMSQTFARWMFKMVRGDIYEDSLGKARVVQGSSLDWTLVRASILTNGPPTGKYRVGPMGKGAGVRVSRGDVADFMLKCALEGKHVRELPYISG